MTDHAEPDGGDPPSSWYYLEDDDLEVVGPVGFTSIAERVLDGTLDAESLVWTPGHEAWRSIEDVAHLRPLLRGEEAEPVPDADPPPPPDARPDARMIPAGPEGPEEPAVGNVGEEAGAPSSGSSGPPRGLVAWIEENLGWAAAGGAVLAGTLVAVVLTVGGNGVEGPGETAGIEGSPTASRARPGQMSRRHAAALSDSLRDLETADPRRDSLLERPTDGALLMRVGFQGLRRLPDEELLSYASAWHHVLASVDGSACERLAGWQASSDEVWRSLSRLGGDRRTVLLTRLRRAVLAEIRGDPPPRDGPTQEELDAVFSRLLERLPAATADSLRVMLAGGGDPCRLDRLLYRGVAELDTPHDRRLARALVTP